MTILSAGPRLDRRREDPIVVLSPATHTGVHTSLSPTEARRAGMTLAVTAREAPDRLALATPCGDRSFDFLNARVNQLVRALRRRGIRAGDSVALLCSNRPEFAVAYFAALRAGWRLTPINWHFHGEEIAYVVANCEARAWLADARFRTPVEDACRRLGNRPPGLAIGGPIHGFEDFDDGLGAERPDDIDDPVLGGTMLYTSGTTGQPKGVFRRRPARRSGLEIFEKVPPRPGRDLHLVTGPLYHAAPLAFSLALPLTLGCGVVVMEGFDAARMLQLVEGYGISHTHLVPIHMHRLLALPEEERLAARTGSLRVVLHGAAPCPVEVKRALFDWLGPVIWEYYAATEGWGCLASPEEWLARPGTVGRPASGGVEIRDEEGKLQPPGTPGTIFLRAPEEGRFEYYGDPEKTRRSFAGDYFTLGDVGYLDAEGYLFLTGRSADIIISGGVNIYPAEVDAVMLGHPAVADAAAVGGPHDEYGEEVVAFVSLREGHHAGAALADEIAARCRAHLAHYKCPRRILFEESIPRSEAGKIQRRLLRERLWRGRERII